MNDETRPNLEIDEPCPKTWSELGEGDARRFCDQCSLHVVDGSALTRAAAADLVRASDDRVCMRLELDADGRPVHADDPAAEAHRDRARRRLLAWGLSAAAGVLSACDDARRPAEPVPGDAAPGVTTTTDGPARPPEILGAVCYPDEAGEPEHRPEPDGDAGALAPPASELLGPGGHSGPASALGGAEMLGRVSVHRPSPSPSDLREELGKVRVDGPERTAPDDESAPTSPPPREVER